MQLVTPAAWESSRNILGMKLLKMVDNFFYFKPYKTLMATPYPQPPGKVIGMFSV